MLDKIQSVFQESIKVKQLLLEDAGLLQIIEEATLICIAAFKADKKILFCGNGGSAADAQHLATEFSGRFYKDRAPLFAEALHVNTSYLTAVANDNSYDEIYARSVLAKGRKGDVLISLSTSGNSSNVVRAMEMAKQQQMINIALTGATGGKMKALADYLINVPSTDTPRIQEAHITVGHILCLLVEDALF